MNWKPLLFIPLCIFSFGCSSPAVKISQEAKQLKLQPSVASDILIYRSQTPTWSYAEIGSIEVDGMNDLKNLYELIREKSAEQGAHAVIGFDLVSEEVVNRSSTTICSPDGVCNKTTIETNAMIYTATGTLIVKK